VKVLAILTLISRAPLETVRAELANQLKASGALYASGVLREVYATEDPKKAVFMIEAADAAAAKQVLAPLPMVAAGLFHMQGTRADSLVPGVTRRWEALFAESGLSGRP
jgi:hypothetical protein